MTSAQPIPEDAPAARPVNDNVIVLRCGAWFRFKCDANFISPDGTRLAFLLKGETVAVFDQREIIGVNSAPVGQLDCEAPRGPIQQ
jgi:hypothetical protein